MSTSRLWMYAGVTTLSLLASSLYIAKYSKAAQRKSLRAKVYILTSKITQMCR